MSDDLALSLDMYVLMVPDLLRLQEDGEVVGALLWRDAVTEALEAGASLSPADLDRLRRADARLLAQRDALVARFPHAFTGRAPRAFWWWHFHDAGVVDRARVMISPQQV